MCNNMCGGWGGSCNCGSCGGGMEMTKEQRVSMLKMKKEMLEMKLKMVNEAIESVNKEK